MMMLLQLRTIDNVRSTLDGQRTVATFSGRGDFPDLTGRATPG